VVEGAGIDAETMKAARGLVLRAVEAVVTVKEAPARAESAAVTVVVPTVAPMTAAPMAVGLAVAIVEVGTVAEARAKVTPVAAKVAEMAHKVAGMAAEVVAVSMLGTRLAKRGGGTPLASNYRGYAPSRTSAWYMCPHCCTAHSW
jgi:hypothetical protein